MQDIACLFHWNIYTHYFFGVSAEGNSLQLVQPDKRYINYVKYSFCLPGNCVTLGFL